MTLRGPWSIRRRMLAIALGVALLAWLVGGLVTTLAARQGDERRRDAHLVQLAEAVITFPTDANALRTASSEESPRRT